MTHLELAKAIETPQYSKSPVMDYLGKNVRCPSLIPGTLYLMKVWRITHQVNYDNPYTVVKFIGSGREDDNGNRTYFNQNPAIKDMKDGDYYFFEAINKSTDEPYIFAAYMHENCVCIASGAIRITCYAIRGHEAKGQFSPEKPAKTPRNKLAATAMQNVQPDSEPEWFPGYEVKQRGILPVWVPVKEDG